MITQRTFFCKYRFCERPGISPGELWDLYLRMHFTFKKEMTKKENSEGLEHIQVTSYKDCGTLKNSLTVPPCFYPLL